MKNILRNILNFIRDGKKFPKKEKYSGKDTGTNDVDADKTGTDVNADKTQNKEENTGRFDKPGREKNPDSTGIDTDADKTKK